MVELGETVDLESYYTPEREKERLKDVKLRKALKEAEEKRRIKKIEISKKIDKKILKLITPSIKSMEKGKKKLSTVFEKIAGQPTKKEKYKNLLKKEKKKNLLLRRKINLHRQLEANELAKTQDPRYNSDIHDRFLAEPDMQFEQELQMAKLQAAQYTPQDINPSIFRKPSFRQVLDNLRKRSGDRSNVIQNRQNSIMFSRDNYGTIGFKDIKGENVTSKLTKSKHKGQIPKIIKLKYKGHTPQIIKSKLKGSSPQINAFGKGGRR